MGIICDQTLDICGEVSQAAKPELIITGADHTHKSDHDHAKGDLIISSNARLRVSIKSEDYQKCGLVVQLSYVLLEVKI